MTKAKAQRHLIRRRELMEHYRKSYVEACRDTDPAMDVYSSFYGRTLREEKKARALEEIREYRILIAKYERIAL